MLITGGSGYIGSVLTGHFLKHGYKVSCLDNLMYGQKSLLSYFNDKNFDFIYGDARDEELMRKIVSKYDVIIPLAAIVGMAACKLRPNDAITTNKEAIIMINKSRDAGQKLIYPNTNSGYGTKDGQTFCTEETPLEPISLYGKTKCEAENHLMNDKKPAIVLRLATVFGASPRMRTDLLVNNFVFRAMDDGALLLFEKDFKRNFVHINDVARCFQYCIENYDKMKNKVYNLGIDSANMSKFELAKKIKEQIPNFEIICKDVGEGDLDKRNYIVSNKRLADAGFKAEITIEEGIKELIKTYGMLMRNSEYQNV